ncbi:hypothetical protein [Peredibacter starrii]|uniref:Uncharacterized protein n=1 Tax=Peredibacter starrii TaxID=28202 RepID=A0AAX4HTE6_9BACT|nr:hypothetical protein [Peredibacter starrii]WPU66584.1 hypothetical protein SOO65_07485 [Peredibacter starrii]
MLKLFFVSVLAILTNHASAQSIPQFNPEFWYDYDVLTTNNCYNYATNRAEGSWAQPGEASGEKYKSMTCKDIYKAASKDWGLIPTSYFPLSANQKETLIALVVNPGIDFHWYRRGSNNIWSHKLNFQVLETDSSDRLITDPVTADRGRYSEFCGYFKVKNYLAHPMEQNAGYVRIGKMRDWPQYSNFKMRQARESIVIVQKYSGRKNPTYLLREMLKDPAFAEAVNEVAQIIQNESGKSFKIDDPNFGSNSLVIADYEGIVLPRNTVISIQNGILRTISP